MNGPNYELFFELTLINSLNAVEGLIILDYSI